MLALTRPKYFLPVHGEHRMLVKHAETAQNMGIPADHMGDWCRTGILFEVESGGIPHRRAGAFRYLSWLTLRESSVVGRDILKRSPASLPKMEL